MYFSTSVYRNNLFQDFCHSFDYLNSLNSLRKLTLLFHWIHSLTKLESLIPLLDQGSILIRIPRLNQEYLVMILSGSDGEPGLTGSSDGDQNCLVPMVNQD